MRAKQAISRAFKGWNDFETRASRTEYWWGLLASFVGLLVVQILLFVFLQSVFGSAFVAQGSATGENPGIPIVMVLPASLFCSVILPLTARRFKDHGWRGRWFGWMRWPSYAAGALAIFALMTALAGNGIMAIYLSLFGLLLLYLPYTSTLACFWIGFVRPEAGPNAFGPNPSEVSQ